MTHEAAPRVDAPRATRGIEASPRPVDAGTPRGLASAEARERLARVGPNVIEDREHHTLARTLRGIASEPMVLLLLFAAALYLAIGDLGEGLLLAFFAVVTVGLVVLQERRSEHALDALRAMAAPQVRAWRDGALVRLPASELVPGDHVLLAEGERVAADAVVREATGLAVDESLLTGESVPVPKGATDRAAVSMDAEDASAQSVWCFAGTLAVGGHGVAEVARTGRATRVGRIGASLAGIDLAPTPLQRQLAAFVKRFGAIAFVLAALLVAWYGAHHDWLQGVLAGIAFAMAMLPEEFPMALAVFLALGAWRLAHIGVLARRPAVVEALGAATVLCVDKTGTLTENRMRVRLAVAGPERVDLAAPPARVPAGVRDVLAHAALASRRTGVDPMDRAVLDAAVQAGVPPPDGRLEQERPVSAAVPAMACVWSAPGGDRRVAVKGAPEAVLAMCRLDPATRGALLQQVHGLAGEGLRVLAVAHAVLPAGRAAGDPFAATLALSGLLAFEDPLRAGVASAVAQAREAGIAVAMITGDHPATALAIARAAGIDTAAGVLEGPALDALDDDALARAVGSVRVFARVVPEQKLRLVRVLQAQGHTVAMTGDGVNDGPALKAAHIGIAMGARGTDVAREAAGIVLLQEDFAHIVDAVRLGRRIFDNLRKVMTYITAIHVPIAGLALLPVLFGLPPLMLPVHVVLTEMVVDPACSLAFEGAPPDPRLMQRPPRRADDPLLGTRLVAEGLAQGACLLAATLAVYVLALRAGLATDTARTLAVVGLTLGNVQLVVLNVCAGLGWRGLVRRDFAPFAVVGAVAFGALGLALALPGARTLLHFGVPSAQALAASAAAVLVSVAVGTRLARALRPRA